MFDNSIEIAKLKKIRDEKLNEISHDYENIIRNLYDVELRSYFKFNISDMMADDYDDLLDDYIDMNELNYMASEIQAMEILIENFSNKYSK